MPLRLREAWRLRGRATGSRSALLVAARRRRRGVALVAVALRASPCNRLTRGVGDTVFYGADGQPWFRLDEQRHDVPLDEISPICSTPSSRSRIAASTTTRASIRSAWRRAVVRDVRGGGRLEGGSTLTQQLARTLFLSNARTFGRKVKEAAHRAAARGAADARTQILELYLNRVYLSAGVYGVETMSRASVSASRRATLTLPEAALIAGLIRGAVGAVALVELRRRAASAATSCWRRCASRGSSPPAQEEAARRDPAAHPAVPAAARRARAAGRRSICASSSANEFGGDHPPDWQVHTTFLPARAGRGGARGRGRACSGWAGRASRRRSSRSIRRPATSSRWSAAPTTRAAPFNRATRSRRQPGSAFKPFVYAAALDARLLAGVGAVGPARMSRRRAIRSGSPRNAEGEQPDDADAARGAARVEQRGRGRSAAAGRLARRAAARRATPGSSDLPDVPSLALGTGLVIAARSDRGVHDVSRRRPARRGRAACCACSTQRRPQVFDRPSRARAASLTAPVAFQMMTHAARRRRSRHRRAGAGARRARPGRREDRHDRRLSRRLVRRLLDLGRRRRLGRLRSAGDRWAREAYGARVALPIWADFMKRTARGSCRPARVRGAAGAARRGTVQRVVSAAGRRLSDLHRVSSRRATRYRRRCVRSIGDA